MLTVIPAITVINDNNVLHSTQFDDAYFSSAGGIEECQHVFINGNNLLNRWQKSKYFTIMELGFGTGTNFLATAKTWIDITHNAHHLHFISIEKHPLLKKDLCEFHSKANNSFVLLESLLDNYPLPLAGTHRIHFEEQHITLTLIFEDALTALNETSFMVDAWYLDGFAPSKNPDLWSLELAERIYQLTDQYGTFATFSAASKIIKNFKSVGFSVAKQKGFANKREMLIGKRTTKNQKTIYSLKEKSWLISTPDKFLGKKAIVIGGGLAGTMISAALAKRDWKITLIDRHSDMAMEGSGNSNAILMPRLNLDHDIQAQLTLIGFLYSIRYLNQLQHYSKNLLWQPCGAIQLPRDDQQRQRMQQIIDKEELPPEFLHPVDKDQASKLCNCELVSGGWHLPTAGYAFPKSICATLAKNNQNISLIHNQEISKLEHNNNRWQARNSDQEVIAEAEVVILANALGANRFDQINWCTLHAKRGQITEIPVSDSSIHPNKIICADTYITPEVNDHYVLGATFVTNDTDIAVRTSEHDDNFTKLKRIIPAIATSKLNAISGRAAIRAVSPDRLPIVGPVADYDKFNSLYNKAALGDTKSSYSTPHYLKGLYLATGFGSRGMAWIPLCAEILACQLNQEPYPVNQSLLDAIHPNRILMKQLVKSVQ